MTHTSPTLPNILLLGFGNIGQALSAPLRARYPHLDIRVLDERMDAQQIAIAHAAGFTWERCRIQADNYTALLAPHLRPGSLVINIATSISSHDLLAWTQAQGVHYLDTCIDPWEYQDGTLHNAANTNYQMREAVLALREHLPPGGPSALVAHGANPGFVSLLVKRGLAMMAARHLPQVPLPTRAPGWAQLAEALGIRVIQISERDQQHTTTPRAPDCFVNTWSVDGFVAEALQPVELGWGSHEAHGPLAAQACHHNHGSRAGVYLPELGARFRVRSWSPAAGEFCGHLISHNEAFSIAAYLSRHTPDTGALAYRPTVYYAYHPCDQAQESLALLAAGSRAPIASQRILKDEICDGIDELGVLLLSDRHPGLWLGSQLSIHDARRIAPHNNATSLQVVGSMLAGIAWLEAHPRAGIVESEALDADFIIDHAERYWAPIVHEFRDWHPSPPGTPRRWSLDEFRVE